MRQTTSMHVDRNVPITMRDGVVLYADVYRPAGDEPHPVLLQRTPYAKKITSISHMQTDAMRAVDRGYAVVIQDVRGRWNSDGDFKPFHQEMNDGYDTVEWCGTQPWSDGNVGMYGESYVGATQWLAAVMQPPHLKAIVPTFTSDDYYEGWTYQGGAFQWGFMCAWVLPYLSSADMYRLHERGELDDETYAKLTAELSDLVDNMSGPFKTLPLKDLPVKPEISPYFLDWLTHSDRDEFWQAVAITGRHDKVQVPALNVGGWYDIFQSGTLKNFMSMRESAGTETARTSTRLLIGPWAHGKGLGAGTRYFGVYAGQSISPLNFDVDGEYLRFFDYHLKGIDDGIGTEPRIRFWVLGEGVWRHENEWPLARTQFTDFYLHSGGNANSAAGDGFLSTDKPGAEKTDVYLYDPLHPTPSAGGQICCYPAQLPSGPMDQRAVEARQDVLVFKSLPLEHDVEVTGPVKLHLWASTSAADTDFTAKLVDLHPDGYAENLTDGIIRAKYRNGTEKPDPITPGEIVEYTIDMWSTANLFKAGHRIVLEVASSNFPRFDRNLNTGNVNWQSAEWRPAMQTIFHDAEHPSHVVLPIIPR